MDVNHGLFCKHWCVFLLKNLQNNKNSSRASGEKGKIWLIKRQKRKHNHTLNTYYAASGSNVLCQQNSLKPMGCQ